MGIAKIENLPHYTYNDYIQWEGDWELIDGIAYAMSPKPIKKHQFISSSIVFELRKSNCENCLALSEVDWKISDDTVLSPDVLFVCDEDIEGAYVENTPNIIFEILSPSTAKYDRSTKKNLYQESEVKYYVIVDIKDSFAEIFKLENKKYSKIRKIKTEIFEFKFKECKFEFDFSKIWT